MTCSAMTYLTSAVAVWAGRDCLCRVTVTASLDNCCLSSLLAFRCCCFLLLITTQMHMMGLALMPMTMLLFLLACTTSCRFTQWFDKPRLIIFFDPLTSWSTWVARGCSAPLQAGWVEDRGVASGAGLLCSAASGVVGRQGCSRRVLQTGIPRWCVVALLRCLCARGRCWAKTKGAASGCVRQGCSKRVLHTGLPRWREVALLRCRRGWGKTRV